MKTKYEKLAHLNRYKVLAVIRGKSLEEEREQADASVAAGCRILELSMLVPGTDRLIAELKAKYRDEIMIGAGTVHDPETCRIALLAGADFIASPEFDAEVCRMSNLYCSLYFAGCFTPVEIRAALREGADIIKIFPSSAIDIKTFFSICSFFPGSMVMPAGGVNTSNAKQFLDGGAFVIGCPFGATREEILQNYPAFLNAAGLD